MFDSEPPPPLAKSSADGATPLRKIAQWTVFVVTSIFAAAFLYGVWLISTYNHDTFQIALDHYAAIVGLPCAAIAAVCIVTILESTAGPVEFDALGLKFKGASGPIVLWVFCFLAMAGAIKLLW